MSRVRRVLMSGDTVGGVFGYCVDLSRALGELGIEVTLATMGRHATEAQRAEAAAVPGLTLLDTDHALEWMDDPWDDVTRAGSWLLALASELGPDVVHVNGFAHAGLPFRAPVVAVAHSSVDSWFRAVHGGSLPARFARYAREAARGLAAADVVVAPTRAMLAALRATYGRMHDARVVPNGVFVERYAPAPKEPVVLAAGRFWDEAKNLGAVARASRRCAFRVELAGEAATEAPAGVVPLGVLGRDALAAAMARASIFLHPARYEPFGLAPVEAALSGCALVLGDIPSLREVWGDDACFVDPDDDDAIAEALARWTDDPHAREAAAARAGARAARYCARASAADYAAIYDEVRARGRRTTCTAEWTVGP